MTHFEPKITEKQSGWQVDTRDNGICYIPGDVVHVPEWVKPDVTIDASCPDGLFNAFCDVVRDYIPALHIKSITVIKRCYFARLSAPGYLDCTEWGAFKTLREARDDLKN